MKKILLSGILLLLFGFGCGVDADTDTQIEPANQHKFIYKGKSFNDFSNVQKELVGEGLLFNDYAKDKNTDYVFDSKDDLFEYVEENYDNETRLLIEDNFSNEDQNKSKSFSSSVNTSDWSDFSLQIIDGYCDDFEVQILNVNTSEFPSGQINNIGIASNIPPHTAFYAKSFAASIPSGGKISLTYYKLPNCQIAPNCLASAKTVLFNSGEHCIDVWLGSCMIYPFPSYFKSQAMSMKWSCAWK